MYHKTERLDGKTHLDNLDNYGAVNAHTGSNTANGGTGMQVGGIVGFSNTTNSGIKNLIENCDNYSDLTTSTGRVAGILAAANTRTEIKDCASLGATILGKSVSLSGNQTYNGVLFGYCNNAAPFSGCRVSGEIGTAADNKVALTADNYFQFVGQRGASCGASCNTTNITFAQ